MAIYGRTAIMIDPHLMKHLHENGIEGMSITDLLHHNLYWSLGINASKEDVCKECHRRYMDTLDRAEAAVARSGTTSESAD